jgi:drug/metabolite transporter (DMT)-like permease
MILCRGEFPPVLDQSLRPYLWMLAGCVCFSWMATCARWCRDYFMWQEVAIFRAAIPCLLVAIWALWAGVHFAVLRPAILWMRSIAGSLSLVATFYAISRLPLSEVFTLTNMFPIWVAVLSWPMLGEMPSLKVWLCAMIGVLGVYVLQKPDFSIGVDAAVVAALSASLTTAVAMIGLNRLGHLDSRAVVVHFSGVSLLFALLAMTFLEGAAPRYEPTAWAWVVLLLVGALATFGQMFLTKAFTSGDAAKLSVVGLTQVAMTLFLDAWILDTPVSGNKLVGIGLVLGPTALLMLGRRPYRPAPDEDEPLGVADEIFVRNLNGEDAPGV